MDEFSVVQVPEGELLEEEEFERLYSAPAEIIVLLSIFYGSISILAVIGNTLVIWVVATTRQMRTVTNMYIANLAFADVIIGLFCIPFQFQAALLQRWNLPWFMCGFCPFVQALSVNVSVFTLTAIAIDRHRAIINPLRARPTKFISKIIIGSIWLVSLAFAIPCAIAFRVELEHDRYREDGIIYNVTRPFCLNKNLSDQQLQIYRYTLVFVQYLVPFLVISFVYIQMAVKLWGTRAPGNAQDSRDITLLKNKKKVIKMLIIVVIVFGLCWLPLQLYNILYVTIPEINEYHFISIVWFCCDWLAMSNSCYNPFIYGIYNEKFKREFNKRFAACFCKFQTSLDAQERNASMHTRASSIRSTYANSSMRIRNNLFNNSGAGIGGTNFQTPLGFSHNGSCYRQKSAALCGGINSNGGLISGKNGFQGSTMPYNIITGYTHTHQNNINGCNNNNGTSGTGNYVSHWRRNNFKPLHPDVIEQEGDDDAINLMAMHSSTPPSEEISTGERRVLTTTLSDEEESSSCICEQELGSRTECDGTCILSEVSRVHKPPTCAAATPLLRTQIMLLPTATTTSTISSDNNNFKLDFNYVDNAIAADMEMSEYAPLHMDDDDAASAAEQQQQQHSRAATTMRTTPS